MAYHSQTLGRSLSVTSLEGIQIRLGEHFKPPEKVALPSGYKEPNPSALLNATQYSFETENTFLRWFDTKKRSDAAREASKKQAQEEKDAADAAAAAAAVAAVAAKTAAAASPVLENSNGILQPTTAKAAPSEPKNHSIPANLGSDILTPVLMATNSSSQPAGAASSSTGNRKQSFDLADFENNASDPFESTELETLNDLEELKTVLAFTNVIIPQGAVTTEQPLRSPDLSMEVDSPTEDTPEINLEISTKQVAFKVEKPKAIPKPRGITTGAVNNRPNAQVPNGQSVLPSTTNSMNPEPFVRNLLPPINSSKSDTVLASPGSDPPRLTSRGPGTDPSVPPMHSRSPPPSYYTHDFTPSGAINPVEPPHSYPQSVSLTAVNCTLLPDLDLENLNRYTPLPPSLHQSRENSLDFGRFAPVDPLFESMNAEDKSFVQTMTAMGFPQARTARAVEQLGHDDRLVVEWLCSVDHLCSKGFPEESVELALSLQDNKTEKALEFLLLCQRFEELGFKSEDVRRELIMHGNNEDTVLNVLTAKS